MTDISEFQQQSQMIAFAGQGQANLGMSALTGQQQAYKNAIDSYFNGYAQCFRGMDPHKPMSDQTLAAMRSLSGNKAPIKTSGLEVDFNAYMKKCGNVFDKGEKK